MRDEPESDRLQFCHAPSASDNTDLTEGRVPDDTWCSLDTDLWWNVAEHFPESAEREIALAGVRPSRGAGLECPLDDCRDHNGDGPPPKPFRLIVVARFSDL